MRSDLINKMSLPEMSISLILAGVYSLRMLGIFLVLPIFVISATNLLGGNNQLLVGLAFGIYGLTQAMLQLPFGMLSDKYGRKKLILIGLSIFAMGSFLSSFADNIYFLIVARAVQGSGAISAVITALIADLTRPEVRVRAMSIIGASIAITFSLSLVIAPILSKFMNLSGFFMLTGILIVLAMILIYYKIPNITPVTVADRKINMQTVCLVLKNKKLWQLNLSIFILHCIQMAFFSVLPIVLVKNLHLSIEHHWQLYLPIIIIATLLMIPVVIYAEKRAKLKQALLLGIFLIMLNQLILSLFYINSLIVMAISLILYFTGLNILEAILPSGVSKISNSFNKGTAMGVYNTCMSVGLFSGGLIGGTLQKYFTVKYVFYYSTIIMLLWFILVSFSKNYNNK